MMNGKLSEFGDKCRKTKENCKTDALAGGVGADWADFSGLAIRQTWV